MVFLSIALFTALTGRRVSTAASAAVKSGCSCIVIAGSHYIFSNWRIYMTIPLHFQGPEQHEAYCSEKTRDYGEPVVRPSNDRTCPSDVRPPPSLFMFRPDEVLHHVQEILRGLRHW